MRMRSPSGARKLLHFSVFKVWARKINSHSIPTNWFYQLVLPTGSTMEAKLALCLILAIVSFEWHGVESLSGGAPSAACATISPNPSQHSAQPQTSQVPYNINISQLSDAGSYTPGQ